MQSWEAKNYGHIRKFVNVLLALLLAITFFPASAFAVDIEVPDVAIGESEDSPDGSASSQDEEGSDKGNVGASTGELTMAKTEFRWVDGANQTVITGNHLEYTPASNNLNSSYIIGQIDFSVGGEESIAPGGIVITIPYTPFKERNGNWVHRYQTGIEIPIPKAPATNGKDGFNYTIDYENNQIIITNYEEIKGSYYFTTQIRWNITPQRVADGFTNDEVVAEFNVQTPSGATAHAISEPLSVTMNTDFQAARASKSPTNDGKFESWIAAWGEKPADADDYFYVAWRTESIITYKRTQPITVTAEDIPGDGEVVGMFKSAVSTRSAALSTPLKTDGEGNFITQLQEPLYKESAGSGNGTWRSETCSYLVRYPKSEAVAGKKYSNTWRVTTTGMDGEVRVADATATYTYVPLTYDLPRGYNHFSKNWYLDERSGNYNKLEAGQSILGTAQLSLSGRNATLTVNKDDITAGIDGPQEYVIDEDYLAVEAGDKEEVLVPGDYEFIGFRPYQMENPRGPNDYLIRTYDYIWSDEREEWQEAAVEDYTTLAPVEIYIKAGESDELIKYGELRQIGQWEYTWTDAQGAIRTVEPGEYVDLPAGTYDIQARYLSNHHYAIVNLQVRTKINPTDHVLELCSNPEFFTYVSGSSKPRTNVYNYATGSFWSGETQVFANTTWSNIIISGFNGVSRMWKEVTKTQSNYQERQEEIWYQLYAYDQVELSGSERETALPLVKELGLVHYQTDGVFYDLLPAGCVIDEDSLEVYTYTDARIYLNDLTGYQFACDFTVQQIENYENSGRTMVVIHVFAPEGRENLDPYVSNSYYSNATSGFLIRYKMIDSWENIQDNGSTIRNSAGYWSNDGELSSGVKDDGGSLSWDKTIMTDLNGDGMSGADSDAVANVMYAERETKLTPVTSLSLGFTKRVKGESDATYSMSTTVKAGGDYRYQLRFANNKETWTRNVVLFDVLETAYNENPYWQGSLTDIDLSQPLAKGIDAKVYYSTSTAFKNLSLNVEYTDLDNAELWTLTAPEDLSQVTAVAVDLRYATDGTEYVFEPEESAYVTIGMVAATDYQAYVDDPDTEEDETAFAYNSAFIQSTTKPANGPESTGTEECPRTTVKIDRPEVEIHKTSDPASGTEDEPATVAVEDVVTYDIPVKNTSLHSEILRVKVTDEIPEGMSVDPDAVKVYFGTDASAAVAVTDESRVGMTVDGQTLTFVVDKLMPAEEVHFAVPVTVEATGSNYNGATFENTAKITGFNDLTWNIESETTYHKTEPVTVDFSVTKAWSDDENRFGVRPASVTVQLLADGEPVAGKTAILDEASSWNATFPELPKYDKVDAHEIVYSAEETFVGDTETAEGGYKPAYGDVVESAQIITNELVYEESGSAVFAIKKLKEGTTTPVQGVVFELSNGDTVTTDDAGEARFTIDLSNETQPLSLTLREVSAPQGYTVTEDLWTVTFTRTDTPEVTLVDGTYQVVWTWEVACDPAENFADGTLTVYNPYTPRDEPGGKNVPGTGDATSGATTVSVMLIAAAGMLWLLLHGRKRER